MRFGKWKQMAIRHVERAILVNGKAARVLPFPHRDFLNPADRVEAPCLEIGCDGFIDPTKGATAIFLPPDVDVLGVPKAGRVNVVEPDCEERLAFWRDQPPVVFPLSK